MSTSAKLDFAARTVTQLRVGPRRLHARRVEAYPEEVTPASSNCDLPVPTSVRPRDRLLLFIALEGPARGLDPVRVQQAMFLFAMDESSRGDESYDFVPYLNGPMSGQIYHDLRDLTELGLIAGNPEVGQTWSLYSPTETGLAAAQDLLEQEPVQAAARLLYEIKSIVSSHTHQQLLDDVYDRFPKYAAKSVFRHTS